MVQRLGEGEETAVAAPEGQVASGPLLVADAATAIAAQPRAVLAESPNSTDVLWEQIRPHLVIEEKLSEAAYQALVRFMVADLQAENLIAEQYVETWADETGKTELTAGFADPSFVGEYQRRKGIMGAWLFGGKMQPALIPAGEIAALPQASMQHLKQEVQDLKVQAQEVELPAWGPRFHDFCQRFWQQIKAGQVTAEQVVEVIAEFGLGFSLQSLMGQSLWRPRGYAGSFDMMEAIYRYYASDGQIVMGDRSVRPWNQALLCTTSAADVDQRKTVFVEDLLRDRVQAFAGKKSLRVLNIASGPGQLELDLITALGGQLPDSVEWECVDGDSAAVAFAQQRLAAHQIKVQEENVIRALASTARQGQYDEVLSVGLLDYFDDDFVVKALQYFYGLLKPGGRLRIGQFGEDHADQAFLELTNWHLFRRGPEKMRELLQAAGIGVECIDVKSISEHGPQLVVTARKPH